MDYKRRIIEMLQQIDDEPDKGGLRDGKEKD